MKFNSYNFVFFYSDIVTINLKAYEEIDYNNFLGSLNQLAGDVPFQIETFPILARGGFPILLLSGEFQVTMTNRLANQLFGTIGNRREQPIDSYPSIYINNNNISPLRRPPSEFGVGTSDQASSPEPRTTSSSSRLNSRYKNKNTLLRKCLENNFRCYVKC